MSKQSQQNPLRRFKWLLPRPIDGIAILLYGGAVVVFAGFATRGILPVAYPWLSVAAVAVAAAALMVVDRLEYWYYGEDLPWQKQVVFLVVRLVIIMGGGFSDGLGWQPFGAVAAAFIPFSLFLLIGGSYGLSGQVLTFYLLGRMRAALPSELIRDEGNILFYFTLSLGFIFILATIYLIRQERTNRLRAEALLRDLEFSHRQLQRYAEHVADMATMEERNRLAREIHDSLGHYMTVINVQLEKAVAFRDRDPAAADQAILDAKHMAGEALKDVRQSVGALRRSPEPFVLAQALTQMVGRLKSDYFTIDLQIDGDEAGFSRQSLYVLYRAAQEGITNVQKHAGATRVKVAVQLAADQASLSIQDNGQGFDPSRLETLITQGHYGLEGVRERLELIRGSLTLESDPVAGTRLFITVPKNPLALAGGHNL